MTERYYEEGGTTFHEVNGEPTAVDQAYLHERLSQLLRKKESHLATAAKLDALIKEITPLIVL